ncbi:hypothetical protein [Sorangium sp. So ce1151]|uniref:hypothetical protein n=1 Tax=Sorangium sp. So ce1151 TaxID=3133332 RepID=UPI003F625AED
MRTSSRATELSAALLLVAAGCGTAPGPSDAGGAACDGTSSCQGEAPPESVCLERLAADVLEDGCGVFVSGVLGGGDDANPGTKERPVLTPQRAVELARTGRGRVFACTDGYFGPLTLPSGVDLIGGFSCFNWKRMPGALTTLQISDKPDFPLTIVPSGAGDTGAADGVSTIIDMRMFAWGPRTVLVRSGTEVELIRTEMRASFGWAGHDGEKWPYPNQGARGPDGLFAEDACSAATVHGGAAVVNPCDGGIPSIGGKGGDGLPDGAGDGEDGQPFVASQPTYGRGGNGDMGDTHCQDGRVAVPGEQGVVGAPGEGIGRITETGWEADWAADGGRGTPGQGGGGGGGRRGGLSVCGAASKGGAGGGSGGAGGCGGRGGRAGENGYPTIGIVALHARLTVRDSVITTREGGPGGDGGPPEEGGKGGRGAPGTTLADGTWSCGGGNGGRGGDGGYGGPGRGGDSIGIAYLDEDQLTLEGVTYELGPPGMGGTSWDWSGEAVTGQDGGKFETLRFPD